MKGIIDGIKYLNGEIKDLDGKIEKGEDFFQELKVRRYLNLMETRKYNPKFHQDIVNNLKRELDEIDLQILINEGQLLTHQKERGEHTWHLKELKQRWRKQSAQDTPANIPQAKPQTPAGATANPTGQATPEARDTASRLLEEQCFIWETKEGKVYSNGTEVISLTPLQRKLFLVLYKNKGKFVSRETLEACWDTKPGYGSFVTDAMSSLKCSLEKSLGITKSIFETKKSGKKIDSYKLSP